MTSGPNRPGPLWREEFAIDRAREEYVTRRQFAKFLVLTSLGMFLGNAIIWARTRGRRAPRWQRLAIGRVGELAVGESRVFYYPGPHDACLLIRVAGDEYVAYSQKCTHLSCAVYFDPASNRLECPCHQGAFAVRDGRVLQGPPPRSLPRILLERRNDELVAWGVASGEEA